MEIDLLARHPKYVAELARHCGREWAHLYPNWNSESALKEFENQSGDGQLPVTLVALEGGELLGTVSLIFDDLPGFEHLNPWLASLFVLPEHRGKSVATGLILEAEWVLAKNGFPTAYLFTESARTLFEKLGWEFLQEADCHGHPVAVLRKNLAPPVTAS